MHLINVNFHMVYVYMHLIEANLMHKKVEEVGYPFGHNDRYIDESKDITIQYNTLLTPPIGGFAVTICNHNQEIKVKKLYIIKSILNDDVLTDSDREVNNM